MRKLLFLALSIGLFFTQSCNKLMLDKQVETVTQTETAKILAGETYTFVLPTDIGDDPFAITTQATNYATSELTTNAEKVAVYQYTPKADFTGTEVVVISNEHERAEGGCGEHPDHPAGGPRPHPRGHHPHPKGEVEAHRHYNITITIQVDPVSGENRAVISKSE